MIGLIGCTGIVLSEFDENRSGLPVETPDCGIWASRTDAAFCVVFSVAEEDGVKVVLGPSEDEVVAEVTDGTWQGSLLVSESCSADLVEVLAVGRFTSPVAGRVDLYTGSSIEPTGVDVRRLLY